MTGQFGVGLGVELKVTSRLAAKLVDRVVATPEDGVVLGEPVVVELIAGVGNAFATVPANARHLLVGEWLCDECVVIDGRHVATGLANERGKDIRREGHFPRSDGAVGGVNPDSVFDVLQPLDFGVLEYANAERLAGSLQSPDQAGRIDESRAVNVEERAFVRRGVNASLHLLFTEDFDMVTHVVTKPRLFRHAFKLPRRDGDAQFPRSFPVALDAVALHGGLDLVEILAGEPLDHRHLVGKSVHAVIEPVRQRRAAEAAVAPRGARAGFILLNNDDFTRGILLLRQKCGPQPRVAASDNAEVSPEVANKCRVWERFERIGVQPPQFGLHFSEVA